LSFGEAGAKRGTKLRRVRLGVIRLPLPLSLPRSPIKGHRFSSKRIERGNCTGRFRKDEDKTVTGLRNAVGVPPLKLLTREEHRSWKGGQNVRTWKKEVGS